MHAKMFSRVTTMTLFAALAITIQLSAQSTWTGGNRMSQTSQAPPQVTNGNLETKNHDVRYKVVQIGVLPGKTNTYLTVGRSVNNSGHLTGYSFVYNGDYNNIFLTGQGFIWQDGKLTPLPKLSGWPAALGISMNDRDQVAGIAGNWDSDGNVLQAAVFWDHGKLVHLGDLQPGWSSLARDINDWGVVVGASYNPDVQLPVVWYGGSVHQLPLLPGENGGVAWEINALGVIAGNQWSDSNEIPCMWYWNGSGYTAVNLGSLGGDYGETNGINNLGQIVGTSLYSNDVHGPAVLWDWRGLHSLPLLPPDTDGYGTNVNNLGQVVGLSQFYDDNGNLISQRVAIWQNGKVTDLQQLVPPGTPPLTYKAGNINDSGLITLDATNPDGSPLGLLLVPIDK